MSGQQELLEVFGVQEAFVSGLGSVQNVGGGCYRFTFFVSQDVGGRTEQIVAAKIIMPAEALADAMHMAGQATNTCACQHVQAMARN